MPPDDILFAGIDLSSGRKPVVFAALDDNLKIVSLAKWDVTETLSCLKDYESIWLGINMPSHEKQTHTDFKKDIIQAGFKAYSTKNDSKQILEINAQESFRALLGSKLLPRYTLEGRLQRALVLYELGLQISDPMDVFEEITRYKLMQGNRPFGNVYSPKELDALIGAYVAWMTLNRPGQIAVQAEFALPAQE